MNDEAAASVCRLLHINLSCLYTQRKTKAILTELLILQQKRARTLLINLRLILNAIQALLYLKQAFLLLIQVHLLLILVLDLRSAADVIKF